MPNVKISELPEITVLDDADEVIINDTAASTTKRGSVENLRTALLTRETIAIEGTDTGAAVTIEASSATVALAVNNTTRLAVTSTGVTVTGALNMGSGNITSVGTVDGRDVSVDGAKLDGIEAGADVTDAANVAAAGAVMTSRTISTAAPLTGGGNLSGNLSLAISAANGSADGSMSAAHFTKLQGIEDLADVTDAANVAAAGALMADGSVPATGDLDMDGNSILNVSLTIAAPLELADVAGATLIELDGDTDGIMEIRAGRVRMAPESGAALELRGSDQSAGGGAGVTVRGGNGSSFGGSALVYGGNGGTGVGGAAAVVGGTSADDVGGYVEIYGGEGDTVGGSVTIGGGFCDTGTNGDGGDVEINGGASDGSGTDGTIKIGTVTTAAIESGPAPWAHDGNLVVDGELLGRAGIEIDSGTSISMTDAKSGKTVRCTAGTAVTISAGGSAGCTVEYLQEGAGQLEVVAPAGTLRLPATFVAKTAEQWSSVVVTCLDSNEWLVRGDLEPS
jgi:hypothetical protein